MLFVIIFMGVRDQLLRIRSLKILIEKKNKIKLKKI
jgi:hypothetical protein